MSKVDGIALKPWLLAQPGCSGLLKASADEKLTLKQFSHGQSNPTYLVTSSQSKFVLRKKPDGSILSGAHDVLREARVYSCLQVSFPFPMSFHLLSSTNFALTINFIILVLCDPSYLESIRPYLFQRYTQHVRIQ